MRWIFLGLSALLVGGVLSALIVLCGFVFRKIRGGSEATPKVKAMKQFARAITSNSDYAQRLGQRLKSRGQRIDEANNAPAPTEAEIPRLAKELLEDDDDAYCPAEIRLKKAGLAAAPALLALLADPRVRRWSESTSDEYARGNAFVRVADLLWAIRCRELGEKIGGLADHPNWQIFTLAIRSRAALGKAGDSTWMLSLLNDGSHKNAHMRREALCEGLDRAIAEDRAEPALLQTVLNWAVENVLPTNPQSLATHPLKWSIDLLLRFRRDETIKLLLSDHVLSLNNMRNIHFVLDALTREGVVIPDSMLRPMVEKAIVAQRAEKSSDKSLWPWNCTFRSALSAFAKTHSDESIAIAEGLFDEEAFAYDAERFLYEARGLPRAWEVTPPNDFPLSAQERAVIEHLSNVSQAEGQIDNGGMSQYFFNPSGDNWRRDVTSFVAIGAKHCADAIEQAAFILGKSDGTIASLSRDHRMKQYSDLSEDDEAKLDELSRVVWGKRLDVIVYRYMLKHTDLIRRIQSAR